MALVPGEGRQQRCQWHFRREKITTRVRREKIATKIVMPAQSGKLKRITRADEIANLLDQLMEKDWVIYSRPSIDRTQAVICYLAHYGHKIAISGKRNLLLKICIQ